MEKYIFNENNGLWYELMGDYYFPCPTVPAAEEQPIVYGGGNTGVTSRTVIRPCITPCC